MKKQELQVLISECVREVFVEAERAPLTEAFRGFNLAHFKKLSRHEMNKKQELQNLISECVKEVLDEAKSTPGNPNVFWLVTTINEKVTDKVEDLADGVLHGVSGISDNRKILMHWLGIGRNAVLVMDAKKLMNDNQGRVDRVRYDDPYDLTRDDLAYLRRIFNADEAPRGNRRIIDNVWSHLAKNMIKDGDKVLEDLGRSMRDGYLPGYKILAPYGDGGFTLDTPKEFAGYLKMEVDKATHRQEFKDVSLDMWTSHVKKAIVDSVRTYSTEGEWVVDSDTLKIPRGSRLLVAVEAPLSDFPEAAQAKLSKGEEPKLGIDIDSNSWTREMSNSRDIIKTVFEYGLDKVYDVRFIDLNKFKAIQTKMQVKHTYG